MNPVYRTFASSGFFRRFRHHRQRHDEVDGERQHHGAAAGSEQDQIVAARVRVDPREAVGGRRLEQRKAGGGVAPCRALLHGRVRDELMDASEHQRHDAGREAADHNARDDQRNRPDDQEGRAQRWSKPDGR